MHEHRTCDGDCGQCATAPAQLQGSDAPFQGWQLGLAAAVFFLIPLITALATALAFRGDGNAEAAAGIGGLLVGVLIAVSLGRIISRLSGGDRGC